MMDFEQLAVFQLQEGSHASAEDGLCAMEAVAWLEGLAHSDHPDCTCPLIAEFVRGVNDNAGNTQRQRLVAYLPRLVGTVSPENELERAQYLAWRAIVVFAPSALDAVGLPQQATALRALQKHSWDVTVDCTAEALRITDLAARLARRFQHRSIGMLQDALLCVGSGTLAARAARAADPYPAAHSAVKCVCVARPIFTRLPYAETWMDDCLDTLDGVLAIGPQSPGFSEQVEPRIAAYRELIDVRKNR